jgi:predicted transcriptional regulator
VGRLSKKKIDEIQRLDREGYTKKEIGTMVGVSRGTVAKYIGKKPKIVDGVNKEDIAKLFHEVIVAIYDMLFMINVMPYLKITEVADLADALSLRLTERVAQVNQEYAKKLIKDNPYIEYLGSFILDLAKPDHELDETERKQRKDWVALMKKHYPEKLAELV